MHEVLVNGSGALSLPRKSVVRLTDGPDMTSDVYHKRKTTPQPKKAWVSAKREESISMKGRAGTSYRTRVLWYTIYAVLYGLGVSGKGRINVNERK